MREKIRKYKKEPESKGSFLFCSLVLNGKYWVSS